MKLPKINLMFLCMLFFSAQACSNVPQPASPAPNVGNMAGTIVAMTFQSATLSVSQNLSTPTPKIAATPTTRPTLFINNNVGCRTGTSANFRIVATFTTGTVLDIVGRNTAAGAWLVKVPNSTDSCWVLAFNGSPAGSFADLPEVTPQPSTQKPPGMPGSMSWPFLCSYAHDITYEVKIDLSWSDPTRDANGYRVYRFDVQIADLPATTTSYEDTTNVTIGSQLKYSVEAYNDVGISPRDTITINSICKK